jgi:hypothetical protein
MSMTAPALRSIIFHASQVRWSVKIKFSAASATNNSNIPLLLKQEECRNAQGHDPIQLDRIMLQARY